jgi:hypothetical protein
MNVFAEADLSAKIYQHLPIFAAIACTFVSLMLIARLWLCHPQDPVFKKFRWTLLLCVPFFGWIFYGALYAPLSQNDVKAPLNPDAFSGGH